METLVPHKYLSIIFKRQSKEKAAQASELWENIALEAAYFGLGPSLGEKEAFLLPCSPWENLKKKL